MVRGSKRFYPDSAFDHALLNQKNQFKSLMIVSSPGLLSHAGLISLSRVIGTGLMVVFGALCIRGNW